MLFVLRIITRRKKIFGTILFLLPILILCCREKKEAHLDALSRLKAMPPAEKLVLFPEPPQDTLLKRVKVVGQIQNAVCLGPHQGVELYRGPVPDSSVIEISLGLLPGSTVAQEEIEFRASIRDGGTDNISKTKLRPSQDGRPLEWRTWDIDLSQHAGKSVNVTVSSSASGWGALLGNPRMENPDEHERPDIVFILVDALSPAHVGAYGYKKEVTPTIDRLAGEGARFETAVTASSFTLTSVASIFTGLYPLEHCVIFTRGLHMPLQVPLLAERLRQAGYQTAAFSGTYFHMSLSGFDRGFDVFDESCAESFFRGSAECLNERIGKWLKPGPRGPFFCYIHYADTHAPYYPPDKYRERFTAGLTTKRDAVKLGDAGRFGDGRKWYQLPIAPVEQDIEYLKALYDGEARYVDDMINQIIGLKSGRPRIVLVTADHGEGFFEHGLGEHRNLLYEEVLKVPLIIEGDGIPGGVTIREPVRTIDIMPTLLELAHLPVPPGITGRSLLPLLRNQPLANAPSISMRDKEKGHAAYAVRDYPWKLITDDAAMPAELYNLEKDPGEKTNLLHQTPDQVQRLQALVPGPSPCTR